MAFKLDLDAENVDRLLQELSEIRQIIRDSRGETASPQLPGLDKFEQQLQLQYKPRAPSADTTACLPVNTSGPFALDASLRALSSTTPISLHGCFSRSLAHLTLPLTSTPPPSTSTPPSSTLTPLPLSTTPPSSPSSTLTPPPSVLGKRITVTRPELSQSEYPSAKKTPPSLTWLVPPLSPDSEGVANDACSLQMECDTDSSFSDSEEGDESHWHETSEEEDGESTEASGDENTNTGLCSTPAKRKGKEPDRRNATAVRTGSDADIGYLGRQIVAPGAVQTRKGFRVDGVGPPVTLKAGVLLTQLLAIFSNHHAPNLLALLKYLQTTSQPPQPISGQSEMKALIADIQAMELNARANDLIYMCKLVQLVLNVDQLRIDRKREGKDKRTLGIVAVAALYGFRPAR
ncbi:hypothetical protein C8R47DRAFT_1084538 [Mycena vitilis]|nr:hypothetical protein C8R47DRAFT_1084538 [Mycena vitilis]